MSIRILPKDVVDRIAAGEVIQRPANAIKEVLENSLDAGATKIIVTMESPDSWTINDNGKGMSPEDLQLAATRHATSKLSSADDLETLVSFGFRGEALASISMCAYLTIVTKPAGVPIGFKQQFRDGAPVSDSAQPCARPQGTTVTIESMFYNLPHRRKASTGSDAYNQVLQTLQSYAILVAHRGVSIVCQKKMKGNFKVDLNSTAAVMQCTKGPNKEEQAQATKQVLQQVYGTQLTPYLREFESHMEASGTTDSHEKDSGTDGCTYSCHGFVTSPSYTQNKRTTFVLFCNQRLVECSPLKRALESVYAEYSKDKPLVFWSVHVPPHQVDVNVHPTKRQVTLLHLDAICNHLQHALRAFLQRQGQSFRSESVVPALSQQLLFKRKRDKENDDSNITVRNTSSLSERGLSQPSVTQALTEPKLPPSKLIRTSRSSQHGSIEPFVMSQAPQQLAADEFTEKSDGSYRLSQSSLLQEQESMKPMLNGSFTPVEHKDDCPLRNKDPSNNDTDMNEPGAFAKLAAMCSCRQTAAEEAVLIRPSMAQPRSTVAVRQIKTSACQLASISKLRRMIAQETADTAVTDRLRSSCLVGVISHTLCLLQCGPDLVLLNYYDFAYELFYQLALLQFGALGHGRLARPVDIEEVVAQFLELEDRLLQDDLYDDKDEAEALLIVSATNQSIAQQAASFLHEKSPMLREYFSISIVKDERGRIMLTGLPVLLQNHTPSPHGIALFLIRLATEVNYTKEKKCFHGICRELGILYASVSATDEASWYPLVRHCLFPAITTHLTPSKQLPTNSMKTVGNLTQLYKVFERC